MRGYIYLDSDYIYVLSQEAFIETVGTEGWLETRVKHLPALYIHERADSSGYNQTKVLLDEYPDLLDYDFETERPPTMDSRNDFK